MEADNFSKLVFTFLNKQDNGVKKKQTKNRCRRKLSKSLV